jgi:hypothetical protein
MELKNEPNRGNPECRSAFADLSAEALAKVEATADKAPTRPS